VDKKGERYASYAGAGGDVEVIGDSSVRVAGFQFECVFQIRLSFSGEYASHSAAVDARNADFASLVLHPLFRSPKTEHGNRMNDGTFRGGPQAFKLDTLLKLSDVKGKDGKTTLLNFAVQETIRSEGVRAARAAKESRSSSSIKSDDLLEEHPMTQKSTTVA
jgi:hypothetical protein